MSGFLRPEALWIIPIVFLAVILFERWRWVRTMRVLVRLGQENLAPRLRSRRLKSLMLFLAAVAMGLLALAGPYSAGITYQQGLRAVVVFDVSRSMGAADYTEPMPTRFERAKDALVQVLRRWPESEISLVVFAGKGFIWIPRMRDMQTLEWIVENWIELGMAPKEGSNLDSGLEAAFQVLTTAHAPREGEDVSRYWWDPATGRVNYWRDPATGRIAAAVIVFSDGVPDSFPEKALKLYQREGVKIVVAGVGQPRDITVTLADKKTYNVPLNETMLAAVASATGGEYVRIAHGSEAADALSRHKEFFAPIPLEGINRDLYQWPLAVSFFLILIWILREMRK
jgi:Ca-activated chloride channel family protein